MLLLAVAGCRESKSTTGGGPARATVSNQYREDLLNWAIDGLDRPEEYLSDEAFGRATEQFAAAAESKKPLGDTLLAAWPQPEMLRQIGERLNQWIRAQTAAADWKPDPMIATLPKRLAELPQVKDLGRMEFSHFDGFMLQEAVWMRNVGRWARGDALDDLEKARNLFDWTVRNIQLESKSSDRVPQFPWEALLLGHGDADERAWVFIRLLRQAGIDAAMLGLGDDARPWCVAVLIEGKAYLFDPALGLPIPSADGVTRDAEGELLIRPATLAEVIADEKLLRRLDADRDHVYPVKAFDLKQVSVLLEAGPASLSLRMKLLEARLAGSRKFVLTASPTPDTERWKAAGGVAGARLWLRPYETIERRSRMSREEIGRRLGLLWPLYATYEERTTVRNDTPEGKQEASVRVVRVQALGKGRMLQLSGEFTGDDGAGAIHYFQLARPANEQLRLSSADPRQKVLHFSSKITASYWLGLISYQRGNYRAAVHYFAALTLGFNPDGPWAPGARYNLARTLEAAGRTDDAIQQYRENSASPGYAGDLLRAKWLREASAER